ncbi:unnamed protein product, partial [marine sediment metagenome]
MIIPIRWGDLVRKLKKFNLQENPLVFSYFEDEVNLILYLETQVGNILCSSISKEELEKLFEGGTNAFKKQFLMGA